MLCPNEYDELCLRCTTARYLEETYSFHIPCRVIRDLQTISNNNVVKNKSIEERQHFGSALCDMQTCSVLFENENFKVIEVPLVIHKLCTFLNDQFETEGLFRVSGSHKRITALKAKLEDGGEVVTEHPHDVANILSQLLRQLSVTLIPKCLNSVIQQVILVDEGNKIDVVALFCLMLPPCHLHTLMYLAHFFNKVTTHCDKNKMSPSSLATVVAPNIVDLDLHCIAVEGRNCNTIGDHTLFVQLLIENWFVIGKVPSNLVGNLCLANQCCHKDQLMAIVETNESNRRRSFAGRLLRTVCGKNNRGSVSAQTDDKKRSREAHEDVCPAKRRSLQGVTEAIKPFKFADTDVPKINFIPDATTANYDPVPKPLRHDSGSTKCFSSHKVKGKRTKRNSLKVLNPFRMGVPHPVDQREEETESFQEASRNRSSTFNISAPDIDKKRVARLKKITYSFFSPAVRRRNRSKSRDNSLEASTSNLQASKSAPLVYRNPSTKRTSSTSSSEPNLSPIESNTRVVQLSPVNFPPNILDLSLETLLVHNRNTDSSNPRSDDATGSNSRLSDITGSDVLLDASRSTNTCDNLRTPSPIKPCTPPQSQILLDSIQPPDEDQSLPCVVDDLKTPSNKLVTSSTLPNFISDSPDTLSLNAAIILSDLDETCNEKSEKSQNLVKKCVTASCDEANCHQDDETSLVASKGCSDFSHLDANQTNNSENQKSLAPCPNQNNSDESKQTTDADNSSHSVPCPTEDVDHIFIDCKAVLESVIEQVENSIVSERDNSISVSHSSSGRKLVLSNVRLRSLENKSSRLKRSKVISRRSGISLLEDIHTKTTCSPIRKPAFRRLNLQSFNRSPRVSSSKIPLLSVAPTCTLQHSVEGRTEIQEKKVETGFHQSTGKTLGSSGSSSDVCVKHLPLVKTSSKNVACKYKTEKKSLFDSDGIDGVKEASTGKAAITPRASKTVGSNLALNSSNSLLLHAKTTQKIKLFEERKITNKNPTKKSILPCLTPGRVSATVQRFNYLTQPKDESKLVKLAPLPYRDSKPGPSSYRLYRKTEMPSLKEPLFPSRRVEVDKAKGPFGDRPIGKHRKSKSLDSLLTESKDDSEKSPESESVPSGGAQANTPTRTTSLYCKRHRHTPVRRPLVVRNINFEGDALDCSPIRRAAPKQPRSRTPLVPVLPDEEH